MREGRTFPCGWRKTYLARCFAHICETQRSFKPLRHTQSNQTCTRYSNSRGTACDSSIAITTGTIDFTYLSISLVFLFFQECLTLTMKRSRDLSLLIRIRKQVFLIRKIATPFLGIWHWFHWKVLGIVDFGMPADPITSIMPGKRYIGCNCILMRSAVNAHGYASQLIWPTTNIEPVYLRSKPHRWPSVQPWRMRTTINSGVLCSRVRSGVFSWVEGLRRKNGARKKAKSNHWHEQIPKIASSYEP